jgi:putative ABC transport system permease protein
MQKLFGLPINQLVSILLLIFGLGAAVAIFAALRNRVVFRLGARNVPRRRSQTVLIVLGLMLASVLFSAALTAGDTLTHSVRVLILRDLGQVDVAVSAESLDASGRPAYFDQAAFDRIQQALVDDSQVETVAPMVREYVPIVAPSSRLSEPWVAVLGISEPHMAGFGRLEAKNGTAFSVDALPPEAVYMSEGLAAELAVRPGDTVSLYLGTNPIDFDIAALYHAGAHPAGKFSVVMPMARLQEMTGHPGEITLVLINNRGDATQGATHSQTVISALNPILDETGLTAEPWKQDALEQADAEGSSIFSAFFMFAQFSVVAGIMLIFLLFVMLAAERKQELGIARAVGTQRGHLIQMFSFEGAIYALIAAAVGSLLGVGVGLGMVRIMGVAFSQWDVELVFNFRWRSVVLAYTLGMALTFAVVLISSWRVSRLNIVQAIRDLPDLSVKHRNLKSLVIVLVITLLGILFTIVGYQAEQASSFGLGSSLIIIGIPLVARWLGLPDRAAFTGAGVGLVIWWLLPSDLLGLPDMEQGMEIFFLSGIMLVIGAVWTVMYNADLLVAVLVHFLGRVRGLAPIIKTAVTYPMQNRLRTGITLAMFSLIVFTLVMMGFVIEGNMAVWEDAERLSGGFHVRAQANPINPIPDIRVAIDQAENVSLDDFEAIASLAWARTKVKQAGSEREPVDWWIRGNDAGYLDTVTHEFTLMAEEYETSQAVWKALKTEPGTVVVGSWMVPSRNNFSLGAPDLDFQLEGVFLEDKVLPEISIVVQDPNTGAEQQLRVIGVIKNGAGYTGGMMTSMDTLRGLVSHQVQPGDYYFQLKPGVDPETTAKALEASFLEHGLQGIVMATEIRDEAAVGRLMNTLLEGFMGLGLVIGIAALGVVAARSVVERRQQIGILRSLGFQKGMIQLSFLLESSLVAVLGIAIGVLLGTTLAYRLIEEMREEIVGLAYRVPWMNLMIVVVIAFGASLLTTVLPARQAAKVYPAEALRFE